jgi:predicted O-methyltransferase YrrM
MLENFSFTVDWFGLNIGVWQQMLSPWAGKPNLVFLEIGCFEGRATIWLLGNILTSKTSKIHCVDIFEGDYEQRFDHNMKVAKCEDQVTKVKGYSQEALRKLPLNHYDFIYVDASHVAPDVLEDAILSFSLLKSEGIMIFDDYEWDQSNDEYLVPKMAIDAFLRVYSRKYELLHKGYQVVVKKI